MRGLGGCYKKEKRAYKPFVKYKCYLTAWDTTIRARARARGCTLELHLATELFHTEWGIEHLGFDIGLLFNMQKYILFSKKQNISFFFRNFICLAYPKPAPRAAGQASGGQY